jgi:arylsulfatase A-like enzyme
LTGAEGPARPNFLLFITDQHRADHLGCDGNPVLRTPHIDALAQQGQRFTQCHVATPICQPNRASLMTGRLPSLHGVQMNGRELSLGETTFVDVLRHAGWRTALVGKAHLQNITAAPPPWPAAGQRVPHDALRPYPGRYGQEVAASWAADEDFDLDLPYYGFEQVQLSIGHGDDQQGHAGAIDAQEIRAGRTVHRTPLDPGGLIGRVRRGNARQGQDRHQQQRDKHQAGRCRHPQIRHTCVEQGLAHRFHDPRRQDKAGAQDRPQHLGRAAPLDIAEHQPPDQPQR